MGNGAATLGGGGLTYDSVEEILRERRRRTGDGQVDLEELRLLFLEAIRLELLDVLELLMAQAPAVKVNPVCLAANACKFESLDLIINGGAFIPSNLTEGIDGENPLHLVAKNPIPESSLCASLLIGIGGHSMVRAKTASGETIFHLAARVNNAAFVKTVAYVLATTNASSSSVSASTSASASASALLTKLLAMKDNTGLTATQIATRLRHSETLAVFDQIRSVPSRYQVDESAVDQARIMQVWEKFFENAARRMMGDMFLPEDDSTPILAPISPRKLKSNSNSSKSGCIGAKLLGEWFQQILCHSESAQTCYVVNKITGQSQWFDDFFGAFEPYMSRQQQAPKSLPTCLDAACGQGWIAFFDPWKNTTSFFNTLTWATTETYLPLGEGTPRQNCLELGLTSASLDPEDVWFAPDQASAARWVQVTTIQASSRVAGQSEHKEEFEKAQIFFYNLLTGQTMESEPENWQIYDGWRLCCESDDYVNLFWYCDSTAKSVWCESV